MTNTKPHDNPFSDSRFRRVLKTFLQTLACVVLVSSAAGENKARATITGMPNVTITSHNNPTHPVQGGVRWFMPSHHRILERNRHNNFDVVFLGDSITEGWPHDLLNKHFGKHRPVINGIGGDRAENVLWRLNHGELDGKTPKLVVLLLGTNNSGMNTPGEMALGVGTVIQRLAEVVPNAKILLLGIFPVTHDGRNAKIKEANTFLAKMHDGKRVHYMNLNANFLDPEGKLRTDMLKDGVHLTRHGYAMWGATTSKKVTQLVTGAE